MKTFTAQRPRGLFSLTLIGTVALLAACASMPSVDAPTALNQANAAMGGTALRTLQFEASGSGGVFGQAYQPGTAWPKLNVTMFSRLMDYDGGALRPGHRRDAGR